MGKTKSGCSQARGKESNRFKLWNRIAANADLCIKRELTGPTAGKSAHDAIERPVAAPTIVLFAGGSIKAERHMSHSFAMIHDKRPNAIEMPAVGYKAAL